MDRLVGGSGLRRGRRDPEKLRIGDAVDFWRVEKVEDDNVLLLRAEMKVPGRAWLQFETHALGSDQTKVVQTAIFATEGAGWSFILVPAVSGSRPDLLQDDSQHWA